MNTERLAPSLLAELYDLEEDSYRLSIREAKRLESGPPTTALRAVAAHANEALDELPRLADVRRVRLGSAGSLTLDTFRRLRDAVVDQLVDHEHAYRRALASFHLGIDLARLIEAAARDEGDDALATWCAEWRSGREQLVEDASRQLAWFGRHPSFSRLTSSMLPSAT